MNICSYSPTKYLDDKGYNDRLRLLFKEVCFLKSQGGGGSGTVTSVSGLSPLFTVANATTTPTFSRVSQNQNLVYASPDGSSGVPTFRALVAADIPAGITGPISSLLSATANNTISNANYTQQWAWALTSGASAIQILDAGSSGTGGEKVFEISTSGAHSNSNITSYGSYITNSRSGTGSINVGLISRALNGDENISAWFARGKTRFGTTSFEKGVLEILGNTSGVITIQPQADAGTYNFNLPTTAGTSGYFLTSGGGGASPMTWTNPSSIGLTVGTSAITSGTNTRVLYNNSGVLGEYTLTGTGTVVVMQNAPTFDTSITTPRIIGNSSTPSIEDGPGAGTAPTVSIIGTDLAGQITVTTDSDPVAGAVLCSISFSSAYASAPYVQLTPADDDAALLSFDSSSSVTKQVYVTSTASGFTINTNSSSAPYGSTEFVWNYQVIQ